MHDIDLTSGKSASDPNGSQSEYNLNRKAAARRRSDLAFYISLAVLTTIVGIIFWNLLSGF